MTGTKSLAAVIITFACGGLAADVIVGSSRDQLQKEWGPPQGQMVCGKKEVLLYRNNVVVHVKDQKVILIEGNPQPKTASTGTAPGTLKSSPNGTLVVASVRPASKSAVPGSLPVTARPSVPEPKPLSESGRMAQNLRIRDVLEALDCVYGMLAEAPDQENSLVFALQEKTLVVSGIPREFLKNGQTTLTVEFEGAPPAPGGGDETAAPGGKGLSERIDGKSIEEFRELAMFGDQRNDRIQSFLQACRGHYAQMSPASVRANAIVYARNGSSVTLSGLPTTTLKSGRKSITVDCRQTLRTYNGLRREEFLSGESW